MELAIERMVALSLLVVGLSHILAPRAWAHFFIELREKGESASLINAFIHFPLGALIVGFHQVWHGAPIIVTLLGCAWTLKGALYFVFPRWGLKMLGRVREERPLDFVIAGSVFVLLGGVLGAHLLGAF